jgi:hypothetical protein
VALVHYPVIDRSRDVVTTAITNIDLHDISRSAHTYGFEHVYIVHPIAAQRELAERVRTHWIDGSGAKRIPDRRAPMETLAIVNTLEDALREHGRGETSELWVTSASVAPNVVEHAAGCELLAGEGPPVLLAFGTGWGLADSVFGAAHVRLAPILSPRGDGYNHLSVRAAAAIIFDRLLGRR